MTVPVVGYGRGVGRWEPDARGRLERAALELFDQRGYDRVTTAEIAARAGLGERTFFRHFADKREALFAGAAHLQDLLVAEVAAAPERLAPLEAVVGALRAAGPLLEANRSFSHPRQRVVAASAELRERELMKLATLAAALAEALGRRGAAPASARLAAEAGIAVFTVAFERWIEVGGRFGHEVDQALDQLKTVAAER